MSALDPLTVEQREIRELVRTVTRERIAPRAAEIDRKGEFPWDVVELFRENELFGIMFDEAYGGIGASSLMTFVTIEELSKVCATSGVIIAVQELGSLGIKLAGDEGQKERYLPRLASGEWLAAYALTEPGSGSDSAAMRTTARLEGEEYVLDGGKRFITNAGVASVYVVFAKTDPDAGHSGISAFVVEAGGRAHRGAVGTGPGLGERVRGEPLAARQPRQVPHTLLVGAGELEPERAELL
ncbi:MAG: acyl-CoA dehydrogenase family protein, partial [Gaiellaceae bacterium]